MSDKYNKIIVSLVSALITLLLLAGLTYAWMAQRAAMTTLLTIEPPDDITIIPTTNDGSELTMLDLDFHDNSIYENSIDKKDDNGTIHIYRPICIKSTENIHQLEVVHTTNLNELSFNIYTAEKIEVNGKQTIKSTSENPIPGEYKNKDINTNLAEPKLLENYKSDQTIEAHVYPLYWIAENSEADTSNGEIGADGKTYYSTYYILEISWKEANKETDLFYIMAQNVVD